MESEPTRRELLAGLAAVAGATATEVPAVARAQSRLGRWPTFGYDLGNTGHNPDAVGVAANPGPVWGVETDGELKASPAVAGGRVYVGSEDNSVYALDWSGGTEDWRVETGGPVRSTPAVEDGTVYVGGADGTVYALDAETGTAVWTFAADGPVRGSPAVAGGRVHVGTGGGTVHAIDAAEGTEVWAFEEPRDVVDTAPAISGAGGADPTVYVGSDDGLVYAIDGTNGTRRWVFGTEAGNPIKSPPAVADGTVYVGGGIDGQVYALAADSGDERWRVETGGSTVRSLAVADGRVYVASRDGGNSRLHALTAEGEELWVFDADLELTAPAVADGRVYAGSRGETVYAVDTDGERVWSFDADAPVQSAPAVAGDRVYVGSDAGTLYALAEGGDATVGDTTGDSPGGGTGGPGEPGDGAFGSGGPGFLLFPLSVVGLVAAVAGGLYAAHRAGLLARVETAADSVDSLFVSADADPGGEEPDDSSDNPTAVWELVLGDVIDRAEQTDRTATQDLLVTRYVDSDSLDSPVVAYEVESYRDDPARIRVAEPRLGTGGGDDARPLGDDWHLEADHLVFETTVDPGTTRRTIAGRPDCPPDRLDELLDRPEISVEPS